MDSTSKKEQNKTANHQLFLFVYLLSVLPFIFLDFFIIDYTEHLNSFSTSLSQNLLDKISEKLFIINLLKHLLIGLFIFIKTVIVAAILWLGFNAYQSKRDFSSLWRIVIWGQCIFALKGYFIFFNVLFSKSSAIQSIREVEILSLYPYLRSPREFAFILGSINIFEVLFWLILIVLATYVLKIDYKQATKVFAASYIPSFILWLAAITLISI